MPPAAFVRALLLATCAVLIAGWAIYRHYTRPKIPMVVPVELPAPELEPTAP